MDRGFVFERRDACICGVPLTRAGAEIRKGFSWGEVTFRRCTRCGSWCQSPALTQTSLTEWLDSEQYRGSTHGAGAGYIDYLGDEEHRLVEARERYERDLRRLLPPRARVLEVGCATGSLLSVIRSHGHETLGVDLSRTFADVARHRHRLEITVGDVMHVPLPTGHFDAVIAMGTVGNFRSVADSFLRFSNLLRPDGILIFNFADADSRWVRWLYGHRCWMFTASALTFMSARGCRAALARSGFGRVTIRNDVQRPSIRKLAHHGRADILLRMAALSRLRIAEVRLPFPIGVPAVRLVVARPDSAPSA
jgi:SAM-dependent methyltransferase